MSYNIITVKITAQPKGDIKMKVHIVNMKNKMSVTKPNVIYKKGFAIYVDDRGFLSLDGKNVYIPCGGRKALQSLVNTVLDNPAYSFIYP